MPEQRMWYDITNSFNKDKFQIDFDPENPNHWKEKYIDIYDKTRDENNPIVRRMGKRADSEIESLSWCKVTNILYLRAVGDMYESYGQNIRKVETGRTWKHVCVGRKRGAPYNDGSELAIDSDGVLFGRGALPGSNIFVQLDDASDWKEIYAGGHPGSTWLTPPPLDQESFLLVKENGNLYLLYRTGRRLWKFQDVYTNATNDKPKEWRCISFCGSSMLILDENGIPYCGGEGNRSSQFNQPIEGIPENLADLRKVNNNEYRSVATGENETINSSLFLDINNRLYSVGMTQDIAPGASSTLVQRYSNVESMSPYFIPSLPNIRHGAMAVSINGLFGEMNMYPFGGGYWSEGYKFIDRNGIQLNNMEVKDKMVHLSSYEDNMMYKMIDNRIYKQTYSGGGSAGAIYNELPWLNEKGHVPIFSQGSFAIQTLSGTSPIDIFHFLGVSL